MKKDQTKLNSMTMAALVEHHNVVIASSSYTGKIKQAGPKTFASKGKAIDRIIKVYAELTVPAKTKEVKATTKPTEKTTATQNKPKGLTIRSVAEGLLLSKNENNRGMPYPEVLEKIKMKFPKAKTSIACLRWYANKMNEAGKVMPDRPRATSK